MRILGKTRQLAEAVVATLSQQKPSLTSVLLRSFTLRDWERSYYWLDASGVALYFLEAVKQQPLESLIPVSVLRRLDVVGGWDLAALSQRSPESAASQIIVRQA